MTHNQRNIAEVVKAVDNFPFGLVENLDANRARPDREEAQDRFLSAWEEFRDATFDLAEAYGVEVRW